jgi:Mn2+/Fe2+ NRAMP family transporter
LIAGCALTAVDVIIILIFYNPTGSMRRLRIFEIFVMLLVLAVVGCFIVQGIGVGEILQGYIPSSSIVEPEGCVFSLALYVPPVLLEIDMNLTVGFISVVAFLGRL